MDDLILIIDDDAAIRENLAEILELANYKTLTAANGKMGLEIVKANHPDLILCDIMMPGLDGFGVLSAIENIPEMVGRPFIFLTAQKDKSGFRKAMDLGVDDYLTKPFYQEELLRVVGLRLKKSRLLKKKFSMNIEGLHAFISEAKSLDELKTLAGKQTVKKFKKKDIIFFEGDTPNFLYMIVSGKVKTYKTNDLGKDYITEIYNTADFFGYTDLLEDNHKESAMAIDDSEIAMISKDDFFQLLFLNHEVSIAFIKILTRNLAEAEEKLLKFAYDSARKKVAEALLFICRKYNKGNNAMSFPSNRDNISAVAGLAPESVSRNLTDLREEGLIKIDNSIITILNYKQLESLRG